MDRAIPDGLVTGHETLISGLNLPDPDDRHVLNHRPDEALRDLALGIAHNAVNQPLNNDMQRILDNTREQLRGNAVSTGVNDLSGKPKAPVRNIFLRTLLICH